MMQQVGQLFRRLNTMKSKLSIIQYKLNKNIIVGSNCNLNGTKFNVTSGILTIGNNFSSSNNSYIGVAGGSVEIGDNVFLNRNCLIASKGKIEIGNNCCFGPNVIIYDHDHKFGSNGVESGYNVSEVNIGNNVWIGAGVTILRGTKIGDNCVIGAGSIVKGLIPNNMLVKGENKLNVSPLINKS